MTCRLARSEATINLQRAARSIMVAQRQASRGCSLRSQFRRVCGCPLRGVRKWSLSNEQLLSSLRSSFPSFAPRFRRSLPVFTLTRALNNHLLCSSLSSLHTMWWPLWGVRTASLARFARSACIPSLARYLLAKSSCLKGCCCSCLLDTRRYSCGSRRSETRTGPLLDQ